MADQEFRASFAVEIDESGVEKLQKALTQKEAAELLGISRSYISRLEKRIMEKLRQDITRQMSA